jgi:hypothetical protein
MLIHGSCHCRNITFRLDWAPEPAAIPARACTCTFCQKHGGVWTSCPTGALAVKIADESRVNRYMFGTGTAEFHICSNCGVVPLVTSRIDGQLFAVVSVHAFEGVDPAMLTHAPATFDGEAETDRLARRKRNWIGRVEIDAGQSGRPT